MSGGRPTVWLEASGLEVRYGDRVALHPLDLVVPGGTLLAVTGSSGSGKSSLLWALSGGLRPSAGTVGVDGSVIESREQALRAGVVLLPQAGGLVSTLTAEENGLVGVLATGVEPAEAGARVVDALAAVGLDEERRHLAEELSGGQQQRAAIAVLLASRARVLLLDEPTSELDAANRQRVLAALRAEADAGCVVVVATHDPEAAEPADAELVLNEGRASWARPLAAGRPA
ncbi:ATP-binding cassette domain-containing protein [Nocardioides pocheonensis]|uniref:ATP-binding cassette domain-containing protein n=1 Tax=Nocardioides pocheonensis TaxID=661485 RepID=A0A3N0GN41_9ACTN|nr:ATP-binding cassette domain-containing protein [Nocardioides pocheonensis]RNM13884.1 ATP-binding cassette domain-containing protein [Nocardioides pocheonensis]